MRGNPGRSVSAGSSYEHPQMTPDVYQRNGIAYKPSARASAAATHSPASPEVDAARGNVSQSRILDNKSSSSHSGLCCCLRSMDPFNKRRNANSKKNRCRKRNPKQGGKTQILRVYIQNQTQPGTVRPVSPCMNFDHINQAVVSAHLCKYFVCRKLEFTVPTMQP